LAEHFGRFSPDPGLPLFEPLQVDLKRGSALYALLENPLHLLHDRTEFDLSDIHADAVDDMFAPVFHESSYFATLRIEQEEIGSIPPDSQFGANVRPTVLAVEGNSNEPVRQIGKVFVDPRLLPEEPAGYASPAVEDVSEDGFAFPVGLALGLGPVGQPSRPFCRILQGVEG
jgi:hypothetical protein